MGRNKGELFTFRFPPVPDEKPTQEDFEEGRRIAAELDEREGKARKTAKKKPRTSDAPKVKIEAQDISGILSGLFGGGDD